MAENVGVLSVTVTAVDKATATINSVRDRVGTVIEPTRQLTAAFGRLSEASGLARVSSGLSTAAGHATSFAKSLAFAAVPLAGGGIIAGATSSATAFVNTGRQLLSGARALEMSVPQLHAFQNGARLAGIGAENATDGLKSFGQVLYDAVGGRNAEAMAASQLPRLGFNLRDASGRARTASDALGDVAESIARLNNAPREQAQLAKVYGVEALLPMLRRGRAGVAELLAQGRSVGTLTQGQAEQAKRLELQWDSMRAVGDRLALTVGGALAPAMERGITRAQTWAQANEATISTALVGRLEQAGRGTWTFVSAVDRAVTSTVGWETATTALEVLLAGRLLKTLTGINAATALFSASRLPLWALRMLGLGGAAVGAGMALSQLGEQRDKTGERQREQERNFAERGRANGFYGENGGNELYGLGLRLRMGLGLANRPGSSGFGSGTDRRRAQDLVQPGPPPRDLLGLIGRSEGTDRGRGYNETLGYGAYAGGPRDLTRMTLAQVDQMQSEMLRHPANSLNSSAAGRYQITQTTLRGLRQELGLTGSERYDEGMQDRLATALAERRGLRAFQAGRISREEFQSRLAQEWASIPDPRTGLGFYPNQRRPGVDQGTVSSVLDGARTPAQPPASGPQTAQPARSSPRTPELGAYTRPEPQAAPRPTPAPATAPAPAAAPVPSPLDGAQPQRMSGSVDVNISLAGAERGTKVMARGQGIASVAPPRVEHAMLDWDSA